MLFSCIPYGKHDIMGDIENPDRTLLRRPILGKKEKDGKKRVEKGSQ